MYSKSLVSSLLMLLPVLIFAQEKNYWEKASPNDIPQKDIIEYSLSVENPVYFNLNKSSIATYLSTAPDRYEATSSPVLVAIPNPEGKTDTFEIFSTQTMSPDLAQSLPSVKSYVGRNISNKSHALRITVSPQGFFGMTTGSRYGQTFINPFAKNTNTYIVFSKKDAVRNNMAAFHCEVVDTNTVNLSKASVASPKFIDGGILRRYRLGVAATVEYSEYHWLAAGLTAGNTDADKKDAVQTAIVVTIDRVNQVYERDLGITLELIANNRDVIYLGDANNDPYTDSSSTALINENQTVFDAVILTGNYDIGHVFSTGGGGLASTPSVCNSNAKARGVTGQGNPVGDYFDVDYVAHEIGHQFGANHTQNNNCNRNATTAVETGSANTIMGYAGICAPNVQSNSDAMFHYISISEISNRFVSINNSTGGCAQEVTIANTEPVVQSIPNYIIPINTPLLLEATATDANGDGLTYSWEQLDNQAATMPPQSTSTGGPSFRTFLPSNNPVRYFPAMSTLLTNSYSNTWEVLPNVDRTLNFGVVIRDNNILGGQVSSETTTLTVDVSSGPFRVSSQTGNGSTIAWGTNTTETINWNVANTNNSSGVNSQYVDILLSTDNGQNFDTVLAENTSNDGSKDIVVPYIISSNSRIMVKAADNVFFDVNEANINITDSGTTCIAPQNITVNNVTNDSVDISWSATESNPSNGYDYFLTTDGSIPNALTTPTGNVGSGITTANITSLFSNANYDIYIRSNCGIGDLSVWSTSRNFTRTCTIITAPYTEDFNGADWLVGSTSSYFGECWNRNPSDDTSNYSWKVGTGSTPTSGTGPSDDFNGAAKYIYTEADNGSQNDLAILNAPPIDLSTFAFPNMKIRYHMFGTAMGTFRVEVKDISSSIYDVVLSYTGQLQTDETDPYLLSTIDLSAYFGLVINVRFVGVRGSGVTSDIAIDEFIVEESGCIPPANLNILNITSSSVDLSWDANISASNGYEWVIMASGVAPDPANAVAAGSTGSGNTIAQATGLSAQNTYDAYVRSDCRITDIGYWPTVSSFFTGYCDAGAISTVDEEIGNVTLNTINNNSTSTASYEHFTTVSTALSRGETYPFSASFLGTTYSSNQVIVWIDFNQDLDFDDAGEEVITTATSFSPWTGNISIPSNAVLGKTRMRIRLQDTVSGNSNATPCGDSTYGEVEDYTLVIYDDYVYYDNAWTPTNPSGVSNATDNVLVVNGSPSLTGTTTSNTLSILSFKTLNIEGVLDVNGDIDNNGSLIFKSNAASTGQLDTFTGTISGSGNVTVECFIPAGDNNKRAFRLLTSTVSSSNSIKMNWQEGENNTSSTILNPNPGYGTHISGSITGANGFDATGSGNPSLFTFDHVGQTWGSINNTDMNTLDAGTPYLLMVRGDRSIDLTSNTSTPTNTTLRATGTLRTGSVNATPSMAVGAGRFSFIGNPYQAVVDYGSLTTTNLTDFIYVWDASIAGSNGRGGYVTIEVSSNSIVPGPSSSDATKYIAPGQAFFVQNTATGNGSITFEEAHKATTQAQVSIFNTNTDFYINSRLYKSIDLQNAAMESDAIGLRFSDNFTTIGSDEDATKLYNLDENYATSNNGHKAIDKQDLPIDGRVVELYTTGYTTTNYSLSFDLGNQPQDLRVRLNDNHLNTQTELANNTLYDFTVDSTILESIATNRFSLHFNYTTLEIGDHNFGEGFSLYPNPTNTGQFTINAVGLAGQFVAIKIYNMLGQDVFTSNSIITPNDQIKVNASSLSNGMYMVELDQGGRKMTTKLLIQ
jgi:hypothetical protein